MTNADRIGKTPKIHKNSAGMPVLEKGFYIKSIKKN
jgi:hypothetical protein